MNASLRFSFRDKIVKKLKNGTKWRLRLSKDHQLTIAFFVILGEGYTGHEKGHYLENISSQVILVGFSVSLTNLKKIFKKNHF